jgi:hypothetical protein
MNIVLIKTSLATLLSTAALVAATPANAASYSFNFMSSDNIYQASGIITTADVLNSVSGYDILGISGSVSGAGGGSIDSLVGNPNPSHLTTDYSVGFIYDNVLFPSSSQKLDIGGVLFKTGGTIWNLWGNSSKDYELYSYGSTNGLGIKVDTHGSFSTSPVPEPETYAMLMAGLGLMGFVARRRKRQDHA